MNRFTIVFIILVASVNVAFAQEKKPLRVGIEVLANYGEFLAACQTKDKLHELIGYKKSQQKDKFFAMFDNAECAEIPLMERYKIVTISGNDVEFINIHAKYFKKNGMWAVKEAFRPSDF